MKQLPMSYQRRGEEADLRYDDAERSGGTLGRPDDRRYLDYVLNRRVNNPPPTRSTIRAQITLARLLLLYIQPYVTE